MITSRTIIGVIAGAVIMGVAGASLVSDITRGPLQITETFAAGESTSYQISGDAGAAHSIRITAERFQAQLESPGGGLSVPMTEFTGEYYLEWTHLESGRTIIQLRNTGGSEMVVEGSFSISQDPIFFAYHLVVITSGVVIVGFSLAFSLRKPRGF